MLRPYRTPDERGMFRTLTTFLLNVHRLCRGAACYALSPCGRECSEPFHLRTRRRMPSPFYAPCGAGRSTLRPYGRGGIYTLLLVPHFFTPPLENQRFRCETVPSRAHSRPRPALSLGSEFAGLAARYMIGVGFSLGMLLRGVSLVRFCPRLRIWGVGAVPGGCFFRSDVSSLCPVCVHFQTVRNYVVACSLQDFVSMCPLFPVRMDTS